MNTWRHTERGWDKACGAPIDVPGFVNCGCRALTPDPSGPCVGCPRPDWAFLRIPKDGWYECVNLISEDHVIRRAAHPWQPTLCLTCHHAIEVIR